MRRMLTITIAVLLAGCGSGSEKLPSVCTSGPAPIVKALAGAPRPVRMSGTPISGCFNRRASSDQVQLVGGSLVAVAQGLGDRASRDREGAAALRLGYLIGASTRGARRNGLAAELVRRLMQETDGLEHSAAYRRGLRAGRSTG